MKESAFSRALKPHLPGDVSRIESGSTECGIPDINGTWHGRDYWVENKKCDNKKSLRNVVDLLRPEQKVWHLKRVQQGATIFVCVKYCFGVAVYKVYDAHCLTVAGYRLIAMAKTYEEVGSWVETMLNRKTNIFIYKERGLIHGKGVCRAISTGQELGSGNEIR